MCGNFTQVHKDHFIRELTSYLLSSNLYLCVIIYIQRTEVFSLHIYFNRMSWEIRLQEHSEQFLLLSLPLSSQGKNPEAKFTSGGRQ